jgi:hypothetical protein
MADRRQQRFTDESGLLLREALTLYGATVFWNMKPTQSVEGANSAARALRKRGDMAAARLADRLVKSLDFDHAAG